VALSFRESAMVGRYGRRLVRHISLMTTLVVVVMKSERYRIAREGIITRLK